MTCAIAKAATSTMRCVCVHMAVCCTLACAYVFKIVASCVLFCMHVAYINKQVCNVANAIGHTVSRGEHGTVTRMSSTTLYSWKTGNTYIVAMYIRKNTEIEPQSSIRWPTCYTGFSACDVCFHVIACCCGPSRQRSCALPLLQISRQGPGGGQLARPEGGGGGGISTWLG